MQQIDRCEKDWRVQRWPPPTPNASCEFYVIEMHRRVITNFYGLGRNRLPNFLVTSPVSYEPYWRPGNFHGFQQTVQTVNIYISPTWGWGQTDTMTFTDPPSDEVSNNQQINCFICFSSDMIFEIYILNLQSRYHHHRTVLDFPHPRRNDTSHWMGKSRESAAFNGWVRGRETRQAVKLSTGASATEER